MAPETPQPTGFKSRPHPPYTWLPLLIIIVTAITLAIGVIALHYLETRLIATKGETLALAAADIADKLDLLLYERYADIRILANAPVFRGTNAAQKGNFLTSFKRNYPVYRWLGVTDAQGRIIAATEPGTIGKDQSDREWFQAVRSRGGIHVRDAQVSEEERGVWTVDFTAPILDSDGKFLGVVSTRMGLPAIEDIFARTIRRFYLQPGSPDVIEYQFLTRDGDLIVDSILGQEGKINLAQMGLPSALFTRSAQPGYVEEEHLRRHVPVVTGYAQTEGYGEFTGLHWGILVRMDRSAILTPIRNVLGMLGLAGVIIVLPLLGFLLWTTGRLRAEGTQAQEEFVRATAAESALRLRDRAIAASSNGIFITDPTQPGSPIIFANSAFERLTGYAPQEILGYSYRFLQGPDTDPAAFVQIHQALQEKREGRVVMKSFGKDGTVHWNDVIIAPIHDENGHVTHFVGVLTDITDRKQGEEALRESEARLVQFLHALPVAVFVIDPTGRPCYANQAAERLLGQGITDVKADQLARVYQAYVAGTDQEYPVDRMPIVRALAGECLTIDDMEIRQSGKTIALEVSARPIFNAAGDIIYAVAAFTDITESKRAEQIRSRLLEQVISAQEEERGRIARELHDETGQSLTALLVGLRTLEAAQSLEDAKKWAESLRTVASLTLHEVGRLAWGLRPSVLDDLGLLATLERYATEYADSYAINVNLKTKGFGAARLPFSIETTLYRIMQEVLTNIAKHAGAHNVDIMVEQDSGFVQMVVEDDGRGFDVKKTLRTPGTSKGLGLHGMQERATLLNGTLTIESAPGQGTTISVQIPLPKVTNGEDSRPYRG